MTLEVNDTTRRKLFLVKSVYQQAVTDANKSDSSQHRLSAIIGFDWAIETTLKAILRQLDPNERLWNKKFEDLITKANSKLKESKYGIPKEIPDPFCVNIV